MKTLIFFTTEVAPFKSTTGMNVVPVPCTLTDERTGWFLGKDWQEEIEAKGVTVELIEKTDLVQEEML
jgi:hypothetical protein